MQYFGATGGLAPWVNSTALGEAFANLRQRNQFATLTNIGLAALLWWVAQNPETSKTHATSQLSKPARAPAISETGALSAAVLLMAGNAASSSRTGLLQLLLVLLVFGVWGAWRRPALRRVLLAALLAYAVFAVALPLLLGLDLGNSGILARLHDGDALCASRLTLWSNVLHLIAQKPLLGWGWGELKFAHFVTLYPGPRFCDILDNAHNLPLQLAVELGIPLAVAFCGVGSWLVWRAKPWREVDATRQMAWVVIALILLHSLLEYPLWYGPFQMALALGLWLLVRTPAREFTKISSIRPYWHTQVASLFIAILFTLTSYAAWDYFRISQIYTPPSQRMAAYQVNTLQKIRDSFLFQDQVLFAAITNMTISPENATEVNRMARTLLHFSPEPLVIERLIESDKLLGQTEDAQYYRARYEAAFPDKYARWAVAH